MPSHPFDAAAAEYDATFTDVVPGRWFRERVWQVAQKIFQPGDRLLELGCGTGEDARWLARQEMRVTAVDISREMLQVAAGKAAEAGLSERITFRQGDLADLDLGEEAVADRFDGAFSNFGPVNCVMDLRPLAARLGQWVRPGGLVFFVVMGPYCPWEILWYLAHFQGKKAFRRFHRTVDAHVAHGETIRIRYPSPRRFLAEFAPHFEMQGLVGLGALVPPPYLDRLVRLGEPFFRLLDRIERRLERCFPITWLNDHYLILLKRRES